MTAPSEGEPSGPSARSKIAIGGLKLILGIALLVFLVRWLAPSWAEIQASVELQPRYWAVALAGTAGATAFTSLRWKILAELMGGARLSYGIYFHYLALTRLVGQFTSVALMDVVGRGVAVASARDDGPRMGQHFGALVVERLLDFVLPVVAFAWAVLSVRGALGIDPWVSFGALLAVFFVVAIPALDPAARLVGGGLRWLAKLRKTTSSVEPLPAPPGVAWQISALSIARYLTVLAQFWGTGALAGLSMDALTIAFATPAAQLTAFIGITPGGIGIQDAGWAGAFSWLGQAGPAIAAFILVTRVAIVVNFAVLSLLSRPWVRKA